MKTEILTTPDHDYAKYGIHTEERSCLADTSVNRNALRRTLFETPMQQPTGPSFKSHGVNLFVNDNNICDNAVITNNENKNEVKSNNNNEDGSDGIGILFNENCAGNFTDKELNAIEQMSQCFTPRKQKQLQESLRLDEEQQLAQSLRIDNREDPGPSLQMKQEQEESNQGHEQNLCNALVRTNSVLSFKPGILRTKIDNSSQQQQQQQQQNELSLSFTNITNVQQNARPNTHNQMQISSKNQPITGRIGPYQTVLYAAPMAPPMVPSVVPTTTIVLSEAFKTVAYGLSDDQRFLTEQAKVIMEDLPNGVM